MPSQTKFQHKPKRKRGTTTKRSSQKNNNEIPGEGIQLKEFPKKKQQEKPPPPPDSQLLAIVNVKRQKPKLNRNYLMEEREIQNVLNKRNDKIENSLTSSVQFDMETKFFIDKIYDEQFEKLSDVRIRNKQQQQQQQQLDSHQPISINSNKSDDHGQQLAASSYIQMIDDDLSPIQIYKKETNQYDNKELFFLPNIANDAVVLEKLEIHFQNNTVVHRHLENEGFAIDDHGKSNNIHQNNLNMMVHRFVMENSMNWIKLKIIDENEMNEMNKKQKYTIYGIQNFILNNHQLFKSYCVQQFHINAFNPIKIDKFLTTSTGNINHYPPSSSSTIVKTLKIQLLNIVFNRHPSFNEELQTSRNIEMLYAKYSKHRDLDMIGKLQKKLTTLRQLLFYTMDGGGGGGIYNNQHPRGLVIADYQQNRKHLHSDLRDIRNRLHREEKFERDILFDILEQWKRLKGIREKQGSNMTTIKVIIKTTTNTVQISNRHDCESSAIGIDQDNWNQQFNTELNELYDESCQFFNEQQKRQQQPKTKQTDDLEQFELIQNIKKPDLDEIRSQLMDIYLKSKRRPGEPIINITIDRIPLSIVNSCGHGQAAEKLNKKQIANRNNYKKSNTIEKYSIKLYIDKQLIKQSVMNGIPMDSNGHLHINRIFSIQLTRNIPQNIKLTIFEDKQFVISDKITEIFLPIPNENEVFPLESTNGGGGGNTIDFSVDTDHIQISGNINYKIGWLRGSSTSFDHHHIQTDHQNPAANNYNKIQTNYYPFKKRTIDHLEHQQKTIKKWYEQHLIDPLDPDDIVNDVQHHHHNDDNHNNKTNNINDKKKNELPTENTETNLFRLNEDLLRFCSKTELHSNKRLNLLNERYRNNLNCKNIKLIPANEREIQQLQQPQNEQNFKIFDHYSNWSDPIDLQRHNGRKHLLNVYQIITNHCEFINAHLDTPNLLIGSDQPPTFRSLLSSIYEIFGPKRPLNPAIKRRTTIIPTKINTAPNFTKLSPQFLHNFNIIINVNRAIGIPNRSNSTTNNNNNNTIHQSSTFRRNSNQSTSATVQTTTIKTTNVRPYVCITFKDKTVRTSTAETGSNPTWSEQLIISISDNINVIKDDLCIRIFDEVIEDLIEDDRLRFTEIYQRISSKYLGELRIPFSTIYAMQRIDGTFEMKTPKLLLGYTKSTIQAPTSSSSMMHGSTTVFLENVPEMRNSIYITCSISLEPQMEIRKFSTIQLECTELNNVKNRIQNWFYENTEEFPWRSNRYHPIVSLSNGKRVCITRLIGTINLPFENIKINNNNNNNNDDVEYLLRRFVSLIPRIRTRDGCVSLNGVWLTNDQMLNILCVSSKDLGVLLTSYYLTLGYDHRAYLILGNDLLNGDTTFVLIKEQNTTNNEYHLIDPSTGQKYSAKDTACPLQTVYCMVNNINVWSNIQKETRVFMTQFDCSRSADWRPLFINRLCEPPIGLVHDLNFPYRNSLDTFNLQKTIELKIIKKISSWRTHRKTIWNRNLTDLLREILIELEEDACFGYDQRNYMDKLTGILTTYKAYGFPLNMYYVNLSTIVERIKLTAIHINTDDKVEFALAVHIPKKYPNNILSIWIFLLSLTPKSI